MTNQHWLDTIRQVDFSERLNLALLSILEDGKVLRRQTADWPALAIEHGDVHLHEVGSTTEGSLRAWRLRVELQ
jgi:hypothetical protein